MAIKLMAFDLDGTLTQHKSKLGDQNRVVLEALQARYKLLMVGAGTCHRIFNQMDHFPIDIIGNYGMQHAEYDPETKDLVLIRDEQVPVNHEEILRRASMLRDQFNLHEYTGESMEFHPTGALTFPILGTKAALKDKLLYDPDKAKRRAMLPFVQALFHDYKTMIGGTSSFDFAPNEYGKFNALSRYMTEHRLSMNEVVYVGDDYLPGGNDHDVLAGGIPFVKVDNFEELAQILTPYL